MPWPRPQALQTLLIGPRPAEAPPRPTLFESGVEKARLEAVLGAGGRGLKEGAWQNGGRGDRRGLLKWVGLGERAGFVGCGRSWE